MTTRSYTKGTYQMLWDCPACDSKKLLGVDHRFCPNCGSPQEENLRYFPSPGDMVPTKFRGRSPDWECERCGVPNGGNNCMGCGAPKGGSENVHVRPSIPEGQGETGEQAKRDWDGRRAARRAEQYANAGMEAHRRREAARAREYKISRRRAEAAAAGETWDDVDDDYAAIHRQADRKRIAIIVGMLLLFSFVMTCVFWKKDVDVRVQGHTWERAIEIERFKPVQDSEWCSSKPFDAYSISRSSEIHHYDRIYEGQDCRTVPGSCTETCRNVDNGNGSFSVDCTQTCTPDRQECQDRYRQEPVYEDKCYYTVDRWRNQRWARSNGSQLKPKPSWPEPEFKSCDSTRIGCERLGSKTQKYTVHFIAPSENSKPFSCDYNQKKWESYLPESTWTARVGVMWSIIDCDSLLNPNDRK